MSRILGVYEGDLGTFFGDLSKQVSYSPSGINPTTLYGLFDDSGLPVNLQDGEVEQGKPKIAFQAGQVPTASNQDTIGIDGFTYYVTRVDDYQDGLKLLWLSLSPPTQRQ